ncbi:hypothetical protein ABZ746_38260 [Streptomyces sp. NPDC020096]
MLPCGDAIVIRTYLTTPELRRFFWRAIAPALAMARERHWYPVAYARRGWLHGPHADLVLRTPYSTPPGIEELSGLLRAAAGAVPASSGEPDEEAYLRQARLLGRLEGEPGPYLPLEAHGSVRILTEPRAAVTVNDPRTVLAQARDDVRTMLTGALTPGESRTADPGAWTAYLAGAFVEAAALVPGGLPLGSLSFRSHAEAFLATTAGTHDYRADFTARLDADRSVLAPLVRERMESGVPGAPGAGTWQAALREAWGYLGALSATGALDDAAIDEAARARTARPAAGTASSFHAALAETGWTKRRPSWFAPYRALLNFLYESLPLLDVSPLDRYYLCFAVCQCVDEAQGEDWRERLARNAPALRRSGPAAR